MSNVRAFYESLKHRTEAQPIAFPLFSLMMYCRFGFRANNLVALFFANSMTTVLPLLVTLQLAIAAPRNVPYVPDVVFPPVPEGGKTFHYLNIEL